MKSHRSRGLSASSLHSEDLRGKVALDSVQAQPVNVDLRTGRRRDIAGLCANDECVRMPALAGGGEIPFRRETTSCWIGHEVVLAKNIR